MGRRALAYDATIQDVSVNVAETTVAHQLGRTPVEAFVLTISTPTSVYRGTTAWDGTNIYIQASVATSARLLIF